MSKQVENKIDIYESNGKETAHINPYIQRNIS